MDERDRDLFPRAEVVTKMDHQRLREDFLLLRLR
jgi:hypothetical protein